MNRLLLALFAPLLLLGLSPSCGKVEKGAGGPATREAAETASTGALVISDAEARRFFEENAERIRTELHIWQILYKNDNEKALKAFMEIGGGAPFEDVARKRFTVFPEGAKTPWDLGYLRWHQIPSAWEADVSRMKAGETSGIIKGPKNRLWIIKLVDRRKTPEINFENQKSAIKKYLAAKKEGGDGNSEESGRKEDRE